MPTLRELLEKKLTKSEQKFIRRSFDVIGDIAIIELPVELKKKQGMIGKVLLFSLPNIRVVAVEQGEHSGAFRRQKLRVVAGEKRFETVHRESGTVLGLDVAKCYYSPRLGSERLRIASFVKQGERVLVAGSGIGVYPLVIASHSKAKEVVGVEINPVAHKYAVRNIAANKLGDRVKVVKGDVFKLSLGRFDRIVLAMPTFGVAFVPHLLKFARKSAFLHVLDFAEEADLDAPANKLVELCAGKKRKCKILRTVRAGQPGVRKFRVCVDAQVF
ncbi:methyltransferase domain-containing protein [Candidatus Woesearchaeota archaeon]|nr:methyltransferase domain-containing protein [Candidatus Woesearchaeota archaeon]